MELFHGGYGDINANDNDNLTALHLAVLFNSTEVLKLLLQQQHINVNAQTTFADTPFSSCSPSQAISVYASTPLTQRNKSHSAE